MSPEIIFPRVCFDGWAVTNVTEDTGIPPDENEDKAACVGGTAAVDTAIEPCLDPPVATATALAPPQEELVEWLLPSGAALRLKG